MEFDYSFQSAVLLKPDIRNLTTKFVSKAFFLDYFVLESFWNITVFLIIANIMVNLVKKTPARCRKKT